jgi:cell division protein FtsL
MNARAAHRNVARSSPPAPIADDNVRVALALACAAAVVTAAAAFVVHTKSRQIEAGYRIHDLRQQLVALEHQRTSLEVERAALSRPTRLAQLARTALGLVPPRVDTTIAGSAGTPETP